MTLHPVADTYLSASHTGRPGDRGKRDEFQIYGQANEQQFRALLRFDLSQIKAPPAQAFLRVYAWNIGRPKKTELIRCHPLVREWTEEWASWDLCQEGDQWANAGGDWDPVAVSGCNVTVEMGGESGWWLEFDVTPLVQLWVAKRRPNYGVALMLDSGSTSEVRCRSREKGANPPELVLAYAKPLTPGRGMVLGSKIPPYGKPVNLDPVWTMESLNQARVGEPFTQKLLVRGGARPYVFSARGVPDGFTVSEDGVLAGTGQKAGRFSLEVTCAGADKRRANKRLEFVVAEAVAAAGAGNPLAAEQGKTGAAPAGKTDKTQAVEEEER
ncbi:MAG: DNRLRE domain-containing protein [Planctomycetota bacterium]|nr:DNRLRE domain-containing protein [Planctomycetota bacterium]